MHTLNHIMFSIQPKIARHAKRKNYLTHTKEEKKDKKEITKMTEMMELADKNYKTAI